jgi:16S rRNA (cytosine1402-N4)-methyltransferase
MAEHIPVLLAHIVSYLHPEKGGNFLDATVGLGGHSAALLQKATAHHTELHLFGVDQDEEALAIARQNLPTATLVQGNFRDLASVSHEHAWPLFKGILLDIGVSSLQLDSPERGFSFQHDGPLDMRMDLDASVTAATIVNTWLESKLVHLFSTYGEERFSRKIARGIVEHRRKHPFTTTKELADFLTSCYPPALRKKHPHPATRVFQALRIEVNRELDALEEGITAAFSLLQPGGRLAVISFHSLEDRIVKHLFRQAEAAGLGRVITKKPVGADEEEYQANPRSRSAKLRVWERVETGTDLSFALK